MKWNMHNSRAVQLFRRRPWVTTITVVALLVVAGLARRSWRIFYLESGAHIARAAQKTAATLETAPLGQEASFDRAVKTLIEAEASRRKEPADADAPWHGAVRTAVEFLRAWSTGDPEKYLIWARSHDENLPAGFPMFGPWTMAMYAQRYHDVTGRNMPEGIAFNNYYDDYFSAYFSRIGSALKPQSVTIDPRGIIVKTAQLTHWADSVYADPDLQRDGLGGDFWLGQIAYSGMMFLWPADVLPAVDPDKTTSSLWSIGSLNDAKKLLFNPTIEQFGSVLAADIHLVYRGATRVSIPVHIWMTKQPKTDLWQISGLTINNVDSDLGVLKGHAYAAPF